MGTSILVAFLGGPYHSSIILQRRSKALLFEAFRTAGAGTEVEGDSEPDMGDDADMGSTTETGGTKRGLEEFESEDLDELLEEVKLEASDEVQTNKGARGCKLAVMALSVSSE